MTLSQPNPERSSRSLWARGGKRIFDVVASVVLLSVLSPLLAITALLVKLTSHGPVFFRQERAGKNGRLYRLAKFRTMRGDRRPDPKEIVPLTHPEITPLGRVLRRLKIDEWPQLIHVLGGEMSLVGPRPTLPDQVAAYDAFRRQRLLVRPGITGLAQVYGSSLMPWDERILYDIAYVRGCDLRLDLHILARTIWVMLIGEQRATRRFLSTPFADQASIPADIRASLELATSDSLR